MVEALSKAYDEEFQRKRNCSRPISTIEWFNQSTQVNSTKQTLQELLMKIPKEQFNKPGHDKREDLIFRKTKIICTLGKYTSNLEAICRLIEEGTNIFRINMSTIQNKEHKVLIDMIKNAQKITKTKVGILIDLQGPVIRTGEFKDRNSVKLKAGQEFKFCCKKKILGDETFVCVDFNDLNTKIKVGDHIIVDFGAVCMRVVGFEDESEFLQSKQFEGLDIKPNMRNVRPGSLSFQGQPIKKPNKILSRAYQPDDNTPIKGTLFSPTNQSMISESVNQDDDSVKNRHSFNNDDRMLGDSIRQENLDSSPERDQTNMTPQQIQMIAHEQQQRKKFKVHFDEVYQKTHEEKTLMEKEIFENALKQKRYSNHLQSIKFYKPETKPSVDQDPSQIGAKRGSFNKSLTLINESARRQGGFPELSIIEESNKEGKNEGSSNYTSKDQIPGAISTQNPSEDVLMPPPIVKAISGFKTVGSAHNILNLKLDESKIKTVSQVVSRKKKKIVKERKVIVCKNEFDCEIKPLKPLYFPEFDHKQEFDLSVVSTKDILDIHSSIKLGVDFISVSYVESAKDILEVKELLSIQGRHIKILAKIMNSKALQNFEEILNISDGIVIARGYLGMDLKLEDVAYVQKYLIKKCNLAGKPVILSTQIMESMVYRKRPTRAEVSDISNAVLDGIDSCILSSETQVGPFYLEACETMSKICYEAEKHIDYENNYLELQNMIMQQQFQLSIGEAISNCAVKAAYEMDARLIIVFTNSGQSAITVSKYKPQCPILAVSASDKSAKQCMVSKGIFYLLVGSLIGADSLLDKVKKEAIFRGLIKKGDFVVVTTGINEGLEGSTNLLKILQV